MFLVMNIAIIIASIRIYDISILKIGKPNILDKNGNKEMAIIKKHTQKNQVLNYKN